MKKCLICLLMAATLSFIMIGAQLMQTANAAVVLEVGSRGENVTKVQKKLIQWGYLEGTADGRYGEQTRDAVKLFQRRNGLTVDGRVGPATASAMGLTISGGSPSAMSSLTADEKLLARVVYGEARGESYKGKVAVAAVVLNRVRSSSFPNTISGVIYQKGAFSCVDNGSINLTPDSEAIRAAREALNGWDPTGGCLYFYNARLTDDAFLASLTIKTVIGNHSFAV